MQMSFTSCLYTKPLVHILYEEKCCNIDMCMLYDILLTAGVILYTVFWEDLIAHRRTLKDVGHGT